MAFVASAGKRMEWVTCSHFPWRSWICKLSSCPIHRFRTWTSDFQLQIPISDSHYSTCVEINLYTVQFATPYLGTIGHSTWERMNIESRDYDWLLVYDVLIRVDLHLCVATSDTLYGHDTDPTSIPVEGSSSKPGVGVKKAREHVLLVKRHPLT